MKNSKWLIGLIFVVGIAALVLMYFVHTHCPPTYFKSHTSFFEVVPNLDSGGHLFLYLSTEQVIDTVEEYGEAVLTVAEKEMADSPDKKETLEGINILVNLIKNSGLNEISGLGISSVTLDQDLNHTRVVLHHYKDDNKGLIWNLTGKSHFLENQLKLLPANTVLAQYTDVRLKVLWDWLKQEMQASDNPEIKKNLPMVEPMLMTMGIDLNKLLESITGMGLVLTMDMETKKTIPIDEETIDIPNPAAALIFRVTDDSPFVLLESQLKKAKKSEEAGMKILTIPVPPMPVDIQPVIVYKDKLIIIGSNKTIVDAIFDARKQGNGLYSMNKFKRMSERIQQVGNCFSYVGPEIYSVLLELYQKGLEKAEASGDEKKLKSLKLIKEILPEKIALYGVANNGEKGIKYTVNHTSGIVHMIVPASALAIIGIIYEEKEVEKQEAISVDEVEEVEEKKTEEK